MKYISTFAEQTKHKNMCGITGAADALTNMRQDPQLQQQARKAS